MRISHILAFVICAVAAVAVGACAVESSDTPIMECADGTVNEDPYSPCPVSDEGEEGIASADEAANAQGPSPAPAVTCRPMPCPGAPPQE